VNLSPTTVVLWPGEPDPSIIRLRSLTVLSDFQVAATARVSTAATMRAGATFSAAPTVSVSTAPRLNVRSPLAASSTITISDSAALLMTPLLAARPGITVSTLAPLTIYPTLSSRSSVTISSTTPRLTLGGIPFRAQSTVTLSVAPPVLSRTAQYFSTAAEIHTRTNGNLQLIGYGATDAIVTFNGADRTPTVRVNTLQIADILNEAPNTASFVVDDRTGTGPPAIGTDVKIALGNLLSQNVIFGGTVKSTEQYYDLVPSHPAWRVSCDDYTFLINRRRVVGTWTNVSATQVALDILARFTTGFSGCPRMPTRVIWGTASFRTSSRFPKSSGPYHVIPVMFPPGCARLVMMPGVSRSPVPARMGIVVVACWAASTPIAPHVKRTSGMRWTNSAASAGSGSGLPSA